MAEDRHKNGFLVPLLRGVADWLNRNWLMRWLACIFPSLKPPKPSASATEVYVLCWFVFGLLIGAGICFLYGLIATVPRLACIVAAVVSVVAALRVVEIITRTTIVDFTDRHINTAFVGPCGDQLRRVDDLVWGGLCFELPLPSWGGRTC